MDETQKTEEGFSPKHFFLQLGSLVSLYASVSLFLVLVYAVINKTVGDVHYFSNDEGAMRFAIAGLVVLFPLYVIISRVIGNMYRNHANLIHSSTKKWITSVTLFVSGLVLAGDLFAVIYRFLEGSTTASFILKALAVLVVLGTTFWYYLQDIKRTDYSDKKLSQYYGIASAAVIVVFIVVGFAYAKSPVTVRKINNDNQRVSDISLLQNYIVDYWQRTGALPETLAEIEDPILHVSIPEGPNGEVYTYSMKSDVEFELCAVFETDSIKSQVRNYDSHYDFYAHGVGETCFGRTVDELKNAPVKNSVTNPLRTY